MSGTEMLLSSSSTKFRVCDFTATQGNPVRKTELSDWLMLLVVKGTYGALVLDQ